MSHSSDHCHDTGGRRRRSNHHGHRRRRRHSHPRSRRTRHGFDHEKALIFGVVQTLAGFVTLILAIVAISPPIWGLRYGAGFWSCLCFLIAGISGIASSRKKSSLSIVIYMVFSTLSVICALVLLTLSAIGIAAEGMIMHDLDNNDGASLIVHCLMIVVAIVESACGTAAGIIGCSAVCTVWYGLTLSSFSEAHGTMLNQRYNPRPNTVQRQHSTPTRLLSMPCSNDRLPEPVVVPGSPLDPPQYPNVAAQQFAIVAPGVTTSTSHNESQGSGEPMLYTSANAFAIQTVHQGNSINQLMYIMPPSPAVPQPGSTSDDGNRTPPPSYSQIDLSTVSTNNHDDEDTLDQGQSHRRPLLSVMDVAFHNANLTSASRERRLTRRHQDVPYSRSSSASRRLVARTNPGCMRPDNAVRPVTAPALQVPAAPEEAPASIDVATSPMLPVPHTVQNQNEDGTVFPVTTV